MQKREKGFYGYIAGIANAALLQPLENIKMALMLSPKDLPLKSNFIFNMWAASKYLWHQDGAKAFYKGLVPNLLKTGFSSAVYFYSLRSIEQLPFNNPSTPTSLFFVSCFSRIFSAITANPFSVIETRFEMAGEERWKGSVWNSMKKVYRVEGMNGFFKGLGTSCVKEGAFAGFYYALYMEMKKLGCPQALGGIFAGLVATTVTHPFQIIRAKLQVQIVVESSEKQLLRLPIFSQLGCLLRDGQLFKGLTPRLVKKPLANTIAFVIFQAMEDNTSSRTA